MRLLEEDTGDLIAELPSNAPILSANDEIILWEVGEDAITYKVEKVQYNVEYSNLAVPALPTSYSVYGRTDYIVSVVLPV